MRKISVNYTRGQLAKLTGVNGETIRYYEQCGLLSASRRSAGGHRIYDEQQADQLIFIRRSRQLGFSILQIESLLGLSCAKNKSCLQVKKLTATHLEDVRKKIQDLKKIEVSLQNFIRQCEDNSTVSCPVIEALFS